MDLNGCGASEQNLVPVVEGMRTRAATGSLMRVDGASVLMVIIQSAIVKCRADTGEEFR